MLRKMLDTIEPILARYAYGGPLLSPDEDEIMFERFLYNGRSLKCNASYSDNITFRNGKMTLCISETNPHFFILVEDKRHQIAFTDLCNVVDTCKLTDKFIRIYAKPFKRWRFSELKSHNAFSCILSI